MKARLLMAVQKLPRPVQWVLLIALALVGAKLTGSADSFISAGSMTVP